MGWWSRIMGREQARALNAPRKTGGKRSYDAGKRSRRHADWTTVGRSAPADTASLPILRARCRDLTRNNRYASGIVEALSTNLIGDGAMPRVSTGKPDLDKLVLALWESWSRKCDASGTGLDAYGIQALAVRGWLESGEVLVRVRSRRTEDGLPVPIQLQVLESDYLSDVDKEYQSGARVVQGVEFSPIESRSYYHMYARHPGDSSGYSTETVRVPAEQVAHLFRPTRPGQVRGVPWLAPVASKLRDLDDYVQSEQLRKKIESCMTAFVLHEAPDDYLVGTDDEADNEENTHIAVDGEGNIVETMEPGLIVHLMDGKDVRMSTPATTGGYSEYLSTELFGIAGGVRVPYHTITGDLSKTNYSSARVGELEFQRIIRQLRNTIITPLLLDRVWTWFVDAAVASGALPQGTYTVTWAYPRAEAIDRLKEIGADILELRSGMASYQDLIARRMGDDWSETLAEIKAVNDAMDEYGIVLDWDARKVTRGGGYSPQPDAEAESQ